MKKKSSPRKKKKKGGSPTKLQALFWVAFVVGCLWVAFAPPLHLTERPPIPSVTVKVKQPPLEVQESVPPEASQPSGEEEQAMLAPPPPPEPKKPPAEGGVTVPVVPLVKPEPLPPGHHPKIAIVIDDVGVDLKGSERAIELPQTITLSFLPYAVRLREQAKEAQGRGHELLLHMPMEPMGHENPGPNALLVDLPMRDLQDRFETALASFTGFDGVNNHMGSKFTTYSDGMHMVVDELQQRHLFFLDSRTNAKSIGKEIAEEKGLPTISRDVFLDDDQAPDAIRTQLEATERVAQRKGYAVAIGHPHATTMDVLGIWTVEAQKRGFELVPLNSLVNER